MEKQTLSIVFEILEVLATDNLRNKEKITALEWTLRDHPQMREKYDKHLASVQNSPDAETNRASTLRAIDNLRETLPQE